jgi:hypothetical protein
MLVMPNRSQEASQQQNVNHAKQVHAQDSLNAQFNTEIRHNSEQTVKMTKSENNEYRYDAKEKGNGSYHGSQGKKKEQEEKEDKEKAREIKTSNFDIRI